MGQSGKRGGQDYSGLGARVAELLERMSLPEKIGQLTQVQGGGGAISDSLRDALAAGHIGSVINEVNPDTVAELQRIAVEESRLRIPLLIARDVIHGFNTVFPIPLGQAATWNSELVEQAAEIAAQEADATGVNWALAPMLDIGRDPRWGRIAETFGEDPYLISALGTAMVTGYQGNDLTESGNIAACVKHFAGYGATEAGRDYNTTNIPETELRNVHLPPFAAALDAGAVTVMAGFSDLNGVPCSGNEFLLNQILRDEWQFDGFVVSDWESVPQLATHGLTANDADSAARALRAGLDMEMASTTYADHLPDLIDNGYISMQQVDAAVARVLLLKFRLGLFDGRLTAPDSGRQAYSRADKLATARETAKQSMVLLSNRSAVLPLDAGALRSVAIIGPLADEAQEQLGTWVFDGDPALSQTPLQAIQELARDSFELNYVRGVATTRGRSTDGFPAAVAAAAAADVALLFLGEEAILSGEAHCRADIRLPGNQADLLAAIAATGTPTVLIVMAGRPLELTNVVEQADAILYAWHPGTMAGPAVADLLFGVDSPSGKLPVTFPRAVGQIPIYYAQKNTGRPGLPDCPVNIDTIDQHDRWDSRGFTSFHLDTGCTPLFCFGHGLSYSEFRYENLRVPEKPIRIGEHFEVSAELVNSGDIEAAEVVQLYCRDLVGSITRPVKELKGFQRVRLQAGERKTIVFKMHTDDLAFVGADNCRRTEAGEFVVWVGPDSANGLEAGFKVVA